MVPCTHWKSLKNPTFAEIFVRQSSLPLLGELGFSVRHYLALPPLQEADGRANEAEVRAVIAAKRGNIGEALLRYVEMEKFNLQAMNPKGMRYWLSMLPRAELLAARNLAADRVRSRQLASEILAKVSSVLSADAPIVARLKKLQAP